MLGIWVAPNIDCKTEKLAAILWTGGSARPRQSYTLGSVFGLDCTAPLDIFGQLGLRLLTAKFFALRSLLHETEGIVLTSLIFALRVDAKVKADVPTMRIDHLPIAVEVPQLLEIEQSVLRQLVAWVVSRVSLVPSWVIFIVLVCPIVLFRRLGWLWRSYWHLLLLM